MFIKSEKLVGNIDDQFDYSNLILKEKDKNTKADKKFDKVKIL